MAKAEHKSDAFEAIHSAVAGMYRAETVDKATKRHFDALSLSRRLRSRPCARTTTSASLCSPVI
ncbi:hypothetical protein LMIY3S_05403 [Labrys miyagiensis]